ncbi:MAG: cell wall lytic, partial [Paenibacillus sp.]|nr:cell wall lytic [Paenibacillus sp.]
MKRFFKTVIWSCAIGGVAAALSLASPTDAKAYPAEYGVKVQVNDSIVTFPEGGPYMDQTGSMLVPIRTVAEKLGYKVDWLLDKDSSVNLKISNSTRLISLKTGTTEADVNNQKMKLDAAPVVSNGVTYVPLRFIAESFGYIVQWDEPNGVAIICQDGQYHAPAWYVPPQVTRADMLAQMSQN